MSKAWLQVKDLRKHFETPKGDLRAVAGVSLKVEKGDSFGLVGESGCGKSTLIRTVLRLLEPTSGEILFDGKDIAKLGKTHIRRLRKKMGLVFQSPHSSLNPRMTVYDTLARPLLIHGITKNKRDTTIEIVKLLKLMGLQAEHMIRYPHELSGGQKQRIAIARALAVNPEIVFLDEPTSALDVSVQTKILKLLDFAKQEKQLTYFYISHDINLIRVVSNKMGVMYLGKIVEIGDTGTVMANPLHPYSVGLFEAVPDPDPDKKLPELILKGEVPSPVNAPSGCVFHPRCPFAWEKCEREEPKLLKQSDQREVACHKYS